MKRLFVDMDGTLAEFRTITKIEELYEKGYFENLTPLQNVINAVRLISKNPDVEVYILSSVLTDSVYALSEKNRWLDKHLPEIPFERRFFPACGSSKRANINLRGNDFLLDDYSRNLHDWEPPGIGIKLMNGINGRFGSWTKDRVDAELSGKELAKDILDDMGVSMMIKNIHLEGHVGTFYAIDQDTIHGKNLLLLESEQYGDETACVITDTDFKVVLEDVWNGFDDYIEQLDSEDAPMVWFDFPDEKGAKNTRINGKVECTINNLPVLERLTNSGGTYYLVETEGRENKAPWMILNSAGEILVAQAWTWPYDLEEYEKNQVKQKITELQNDGCSFLINQENGNVIFPIEALNTFTDKELDVAKDILEEENNYLKIDIHEMIDKFDSYISYDYVTDQYSDLSKAADILNRDFEAREYIADLPDGRKLIMHELTEVARTDDGEPGDFGEETKQWYFIEGKNGKREQLSSDEVEAKSINLRAHGNKTNNQYDRNIETEAMEL